MKIFAPWCNGLYRDKEALGILSRSGILSGVQTTNTGYDELRAMRDSGLELSLHAPNRGPFLNLADEGFADSLVRDDVLRSAIGLAGDRYLGLHMGYSNRKVRKEGTDVIPLGALMAGREELAGIFVDSVRAAQQILDRDYPGKRILLENIGCFWNNGEGVAARHPAKMHLGEPELLREVVTRSNAGICYDVAHALRTAYGLEAETHDHSAIRRYMNEMAVSARGLVRQMHINSLSYRRLDAHLPLVEGEQFSEEALEWAQCALDYNPVDAMVPEFKTEGSPVGHARACVKQAELIMRRLGLTTTD